MTQRSLSKSREVVQEDILISIESARPRLDKLIDHQTPTLNAPGTSTGLATPEMGFPGEPKAIFQIGYNFISLANLFLLQFLEQGFPHVCNDKINSMILSGGAYRQSLTL